MKNLIRTYLPIQAAACKLSLRIRTETVSGRATPGVTKAGERERRQRAQRLRLQHPAAHRVVAKQDGRQPEGEQAQPRDEACAK
eukprot:2711680-Pleurochrysis_carterae.AAC.1